MQLILFFQFNLDNMVLELHDPILHLLIQFFIYSIFLFVSSMAGSQSNSSSSSNLSIDHSSPYFIGSSDNLNFLLVTTPFDGNGFNSWKRSIIISLSAKNKLGLVDGTISKPLTSSPNYPNWYRANSMVIS